MQRWPKFWGSILRSSDCLASYDFFLLCVSSIVNYLCFYKLVILSIIEGKKSEMRSFKFETLLIALLINRQQYCMSIVDGKSEMRRHKFENLLIAFLICRQQYCLSILDGKKWDEEVEVENLLIAILISKQQKNVI